MKWQLLLFVQVEEDEKMKKRKERFGIVTSAASVGADDSEVQHKVKYKTVFSHVSVLDLTRLVFFS